MRRRNAATALDYTLLALADPTRRGILERLSAGDARVTDVAEGFTISLNSVSKHIRLLERAALAERASDLFGEDGAGAAADWIESDPGASVQATLFPEFEAAPRPRSCRPGRKSILDGDAELQTIDATTLDRVTRRCCYRPAATPMHCGR